jgi:hypothetical protein
MRFGCEAKNMERTADIRFRVHNGLESDVAPCPKSARSRPSGRASVRGSFVINWNDGALLSDRQRPGALIVHLGLGLIALAVVQSRACF